MSARDAIKARENAKIRPPRPAKPKRPKAKPVLVEPEPVVLNAEEPDGDG